MATRSDYRSGATLVHLVYFCWNPRVIGISCDGDDRRIFWSLKVLILFFFGVGKFGKYFFWWLDLRRDFLGYN